MGCGGGTGMMQMFAFVGGVIHYRARKSTLGVLCIVNKEHRSQRDYLLRCKHVVVVTLQVTRGGGRITKK